MFRSTIRQKVLFYLTTEELYIEPKSQPPRVPKYHHPTEPTKEVNFYLGHKRYNPTGGEYLDWVLGKDYEFSIDPSSLTFFGVDLVESNRFLASSAELGQSLYATVTVYQHISDGNRPLLDISMGNSPVYAQDIPVECNLGDDGRWKINLSDIMRKHVSGSMNIGQKMSGMPDECFDIELTFTETTPTILGDEGMVTYKTNPTGSIYIYSRKVPKVYNLTFKPNGGSGTMDPATVTEGNQYTLPSCKFTAPKDKKFRGWAVLRDRYYEHFMAGDKIDIDKDTEILAEWEDCTYRVTFYANDSAGTREDYYPVRNTYFTLPGCSFAPPSKAKEFKCWRVTVSGSTGEKKPGEQILVSSDVTATPVWVDSPDYKLLVCSATVKQPVAGEKPSDPVSLEPDKYYVKCEGWYYNAPNSDARQNQMGPDDVFEEGRIYWMKYRFVANWQNDYEFDYGNVKFYMNGKQNEDEENVIADCYTSTGNAVRTDYGEAITLTDDVTYFLASSYDKGYSTIKYGKLVFSDKFELTLPVNGVIKDGVVYEADGLYEASLDVCLKRKIEMTEHENKDSGIIVTLEDGVELVVDDVTGEEEYGNIVITEGEKVCAVYNVTLIKNGEEVQPAAEITVKIPWNGDPEAKVYRQEDKYTVRDMHATYEDGYLVFQTTHFSIYMISAPAPEYIIGDVNGDDRVDITDATYVQMYIAKMIGESDFNLNAADTNGDNKVDITDVTYIQMYVAQMIDHLG